MVSAIVPAVSPLFFNPRLVCRHVSARPHHTPGQGLWTQRQCQCACTILRIPDGGTGQGLYLAVLDEVQATIATVPRKQCRSARMKSQNLDGHGSSCAIRGASVRFGPVG